MHCSNEDGEKEHIVENLASDSYRKSSGTHLERFSK